MLTAKIDVRFVSVLRLEHLLSCAMRKVLPYRLKRDIEEFDILLSPLVVKDVVEFQFEPGTSLGCHLLEGLLKELFKFFCACFGWHCLRYDVNDKFLPIRPSQVLHKLALV